MDATISRLLVALASLVLNLGARHLPGGLSPRMQVITSSEGMRMLVVGALFYLSTRDVMLSIALAFVFFMVLSTLLNENSRFSMIQHPPAQMTPTISREVYDMAVNTVLGFRRQERRVTSVPESL